MKHIILFSILCVPFFACTQQNTFKYKGELPTEKFLYFGEDTEDISFTNADKIALRNRVYVMIDEANEKLLLNGHEVLFDDFEKAFKYVLSNTDNLEYLPESIENTVIFTNLADINSLPKENKVLQFKATLVLWKMNTAYCGVIEDEIKNTLHTTWENLTENDIETLSGNRLNLAMTVGENSFFNTFEEMETASWSDTEPENLRKKRNVFTVLINANDELLVQGEPMDISELRTKTKQFVLNPSHDENMAKAAKAAVISLKSDRKTSTEFYLTVFNELKAAYNEIWNQIAIERYGLEIKHLKEEIQKEIRNDYPMTIRE